MTGYTVKSISSDLYTEADFTFSGAASATCTEVGTEYMNLSASQFTNTMAMMLGAGLPMTKAVTITSRTMTNYYISTEVGKITSKLEVGNTLGRSLKEAGCLPEIMNDMAAVGEESGELESTLEMTAAYYDSELEQVTAAALAKLEPATLIFMGVVAGYIVVAIYLAMFSMYNGM